MNDRQKIVAAFGLKKNRLLRRAACDWGGAFFPKSFAENRDVRHASLNYFLKSQP
jgi:hypothetical protein